MAKLTPEQAAKLPAPAPHPIDFGREVKPILETSCVKCHGRGKAKGGFKLDTRETLLHGGDSGAAVVLGKSGESSLIEMVSGLDPENVMPQKGSKLTRDQVAILRAWIDQGLAWQEGVSFGRVPPINLQPPETKIAVGPSATGSNGIDVLLKTYDANHSIVPKEAVSDRVFARRVYLDVIGLLPTPEELEQFIADRGADKRARLVKRLLGDNPRYAQHWLTFWNDLLRNDYKGTGYIDEGRKQITEWLYRALANNLSFDKFVAQLINPPPGAEGFVKGIVWRGVVNASQTPPMQAAQNISQVFMGVNLKCASCHDSFINDWMLADAYGLASIYADGDLELVQCDKPTGKKAITKFLYPELGSIDGAAPKAERMKRLSELMTQKQNGRLSRTIVNRLWARFMGRGLVEPLDDMEQPAWNPELLDWLAADLVENGYDLKKTMERILTSEAYQRKSSPASEVVTKDFVFHGPLVRRLTAEQFQDAVSEVTGVWHDLPASKETDFTAGVASSALAATENPARLRWIWSQASAAEKAGPATVYFRREIELPELPTHAAAVVSCDNSFKLYVNGKEVGSGGDHNKPTLVDILPQLHTGMNVLALTAVNRAGAPDRPAADQSNPAGLIAYFRIRQETRDKELPTHRVWDVGTGDSWRWSAEKVDGWEQLGIAGDEWAPAAELGSADMAPWRLEKKFAQVLSAASLSGHVRASLVAADPLMTALGRPNREQVMTARASSATTLQALEMTNGKTFADQLKEGSEKLLGKSKLSSRDLITSLFQKALSRQPEQEELTLAETLVGTPAKAEGIEDLLWTVAMLPEFQLIY